MVLYVSSETAPSKVEKLPKTIEELLQSSSRLKLHSKNMTATNPRKLAPSDGVVYVQQGEVAIGTAQDASVRYFGSEDATTCHILILRHPGAGVTALVHIDQFNEVRLNNLLEEFSNMLGDSMADSYLHLTLVGGYDDEEDHSTKLSSDLIKYFYESKVKFLIDALAIGEMNTNYLARYRSPILYGAAVELSTGKIFPATFIDHGPDIILRQARLSHSEPKNPPKFHPIYDHQSGQIRIPAFKVRPIPPVWEFLATLSDRRMLERMSTSPKVEPPHFAERARQCFQFVIDNPDVYDTMFTNGQPRVYERNADGNWVLSEKSTDE